VLVPGDHDRMASTSGGEVGLANSGCVRFRISVSGLAPGLLKQRSAKRLRHWAERFVQAVSQVGLGLHLAVSA